MEIVYREHAIPEELAAAVGTFWSISHGEGIVVRQPTPYRVLPDGCVDLIARHTTSPHDSADPCDPATGHCELLTTGLTARFVDVSLSPGVSMWGLRLLPGWAGPVLGVDPLALTAGIRPAAPLSPRLDHLARIVGTAGSFARIGTALCDGVAALVADTPTGWHFGRLPGLLSDSLALLESSHGGIRMGRLAESVGVSRRSLHRHLTRAIGLPPKTYARILRFHRALELLAADPDLSRLAAEAGYNDQAHLTREFRSLSGQTPARFRR